MGPADVIDRILEPASGKGGRLPDAYAEFSDEASLLRNAASGLPEAVRALIDGAGPVVYGFVFARLGGNVHAAEDLLQETFVEAIRSAHTFRGESSLGTWLCAIARRRLARFYKVERREAVAMSGLRVVESTREDGGDSAYAERDALIRALGTLPPLHRQALVMKYLDERSVEEIARELDRGRVQVQSLLQRAREGLRRALEAGDA